MNPETLPALVGTDIGCSDWVSVTQARIDAFAEATDDRQFIHLDAGAAAETGFGGTVAHGFLTLSMLSSMAYNALPRLAGQSASVNYGFDKVRFVAPVRSGSDIRAHFQLAEATRRPDGSVILRYDVEVEIRGKEKPALIADWRVLYLF
ncbi:MaoC family dehydratase [Roseobacter sp. YSTF-M11]|uniref:MaoC family dehydratase n=1 Tax=Roseobacter insulae TaxID=2859783 RepID=A0A9X1FXI9_9RHOB|nr:MaoC family dehydratase [Roseobacter insulae]